MSIPSSTIFEPAPSVVASECSRQIFEIGNIDSVEVAFDNSNSVVKSLSPTSWEALYEKLGLVGVALIIEGTGTRFEIPHSSMETL